MKIFFLILFVVFSSGFTKVKVVKPQKGLAGKVKEDTLLQVLLREEIKEEEWKVNRNRLLLKKVEANLKKAVMTGVIEEETCIRENIGVLRTINYVYDWVLEQINSMDCEKIRLALFNNINRIKRLNKLFSRRILKIEECKMERIKITGRDTDNKLVEYTVDMEKEPIKHQLSVPEPYSGAISPFR